nr:MAG: hypothetical protein DIU78_14565 [Pseudomonadota bacterium]
MPHAISCKACGARFSVGDELYRTRLANRRAFIRCRNCGATIRVAEPEARTSTPPPATRALPSRPPLPNGRGRPPSTRSRALWSATRRRVVTGVRRIPERVVSPRTVTPFDPRGNAMGDNSDDQRPTPISDPPLNLDSDDQRPTLKKI